MQEDETPLEFNKRKCEFFDSQHHDQKHLPLSKTQEIEISDSSSESDSDSDSGWIKVHCNPLITKELFMEMTHAWLDQHGRELVLAAVAGRKTVSARKSRK